jgi:hypothetical protein
VVDSKSERLFKTYAEYRSCVAEILREAHSTALIFDPDLGNTGLDSPECIGALTALFGKSPHRHALRILIHKTDFLEKRSPRLLALLGEFRHRTDLRVTSQSHRAWSQPALIVDQQHLVMRFHQDSARGKACFSDPAAAANIIAQIETMWVSGQTVTTGTPLGI